MIKAFYNLKSLPFQKNINTKNIYNSNAGKELLHRLEYIKEKRGIMLVTGLPGTGKTTHIRTFVNSLNTNLFKTIYIPLATVNTLDFYRQLAISLGGEVKWKKSELFLSIQNSIKHYVSNNRKIPIIILDEIHLLKNENFTELQIISNFNIDSEDPAVFVLVGQTHVRERLQSPLHQAFNQRITLKFNLTPLTLNETHDYIDHQMKLAGSKNPIFDQNAINVIYKNSNGTPRIINTLAIKTMTLGALEKKESLSQEEVYKASKEI